MGNTKALLPSKAQSSVGDNMTMQNYPGANVYRAGPKGDAAGSSRRSYGSTVVDKHQAASAPRNLAQILKATSRASSAIKKQN